MKYLTHQETAAALRINPATLSKWVKQGCPCLYFGEIKSSQRGARPRFKIDEVEAWLKNRQVKGDVQ